ncbi:MAG: hypothetical protein E7384_04730 [Ruminococcaceae bacterium]|nr:hypothetical protein [Oscillospiraceae bacterium]
MIYLRRCGTESPKVLKRIVASFLCLVLLCTYMLGNRHSFVANSQTVYNIGYVQTAESDTLNVRDRAGTSSSTIIDSLEVGHQVSVIGKTNAPDGSLWYYVSYFKGRTLKYGYVHSAYIKFVTAADDPAFEKYLDSQNFPESYRQYLRVLHKMRPEWVFKAFHTNLPWNEVYDAEREDGQSSIESTVISSWKSLVLYDWVNDKYNNLSGNGWTQASDSIVAFYLDPRNFLNDEQMFQYELIEYNPLCHTEEAVETVLQGTFMYKKVLYEEEIIVYPSVTPTEPPTEAPVTTAQPTETAGRTSESTATAETTITSTATASPSPAPTATPQVIKKTVTYAQAFIQVAQELDVSPCMLASRVRQEQGTAGTNKLISGTVPGYEGYYNYFNIGASGTGSQEVLINGLKEAKSEGWDSPYKALVGGARKVCGTHIKKGQDTLYLQKFDVDSTYHGLYWHQYMQNIRAASHEGVTVRNSYAQCDILDSAFEFKIPVYKNMPTYACEQPTEDRNPNYKLKSLSVKNYSISPSFKTDTLSYTLSVPNATSNIEISATPYVSKATVSGVGKINLNVGTNKLTIRCKAENETYRDYTLTVIRAAAPTPTATPTATVKPTVTPTVTPSATTSSSATASPIPTATVDPSPSHNISDKYNVNIDSLISGIKEGTTAKNFKESISIKDGSVSITDKSGNSVSDTAKISTGQKVVVKDSAGKVYKQFDIVIYGDITGDGKIEALDYVYIKRHLWGISELSGIYKTAADISPSKGSVDALDFVYMKRHLWGIADIVQ